MPFENGRFALLAVFCGLAALSLSPSGGAGIRAAVVHRQHKTATNPVARRDIGKVADYDTAGLHHNQATFSFPWTKQSNERRSQKETIIAISNPHGAKYAINHRRQASTPQWISRNVTSNATASSSSSPEPVLGTVAIVSRNPNPMNNHILASLFLVPQPDGSYVLDASDRNATEMYLTPATSSSEMSPGASDTYPVKLAMPVEGEPYCATYDQAPPKPEALTAQRCMTDGTRTGHASQIFIYNSTSGVIQPTYVDGQSGDGEASASFSTPSSTPSASMGAASVDVMASSDSASPTPSANASSASWDRRDDSGPYSAQNVTLMFVPRKTTSNVAAAAIQEVSTSTVTSTKTVIVFSSPAPLSASAVSAADVTPSPVVNSSGSAAMAGVTGLSVEVVGNGLGLPQAPLAIPSVGISAPGQPAKTPAPSNSPSPSVDAAAVAASSPADSSAAPTSSSPSATVVVSVASLSPSDNSVNSAPASSSAKPLFERNAAKVTPVSTEPYFWRFKAEARI